jgi:TRAP-type uncharacterized transport system fused permease subunit
MKKLIIGSFVGAILLFVWQALSWTMLHNHENAYKYTPAQYEVMTSLQNNLKEDGQYMIPRGAPGASREEMEKLGKELNGKPWAIVTYHSAYKFDMVMPMVRGFLIALISVLLVCLLIQKFARKNMSSIFGSVFSIGLICFIFVWYNQHNWFQTSWDVLRGELIDNLAGWGFCGLWLGWWYSKK